MGVSLKLAFRQIRFSSSQVTVFVSCVTISVVSLLALGALSRGVDRQLKTDARILHGADIIVHSHQPLSPGLEAAIENFEKRDAIRSIRAYEFYSMIRAPERDLSLLAHIKVVEADYPFYGSVQLSSGRSLRDVLTPGRAVVQQEVMERLGIHLNDRLRVGNSNLIVADVVTNEPSRSIRFFSFGPRVFVATGDLEGLGLIKEGSRVRYEALLKTASTNAAEPIADELKRAAVSDQEQVDTYLTAGSRARRYLDNLLFYLNAVGAFTLLLAGIGIQNATIAFIKEQEKSIAVMKALGAHSGFVIRHFLLILFSLGLAGTAAAILAAVGLQRVLPVLLKGFLPTDLSFTLFLQDWAEGVALGVGAVVLFGLLPLFRTAQIRPAALFREETLPALAGRWDIPVALAAAMLFAALLLQRSGDFRTGLYLAGAAATLFVAAALMAQILLMLLRRVPIAHLPLRQAIRGLFRPRSTTLSIIVTLGASLSIVFAIYLIEKNLNASFLHSFPPDSPNLFFLDIQPHQKADFETTVGLPAVYYPVVRARIVSINGAPIDRAGERRRRGDNLARTFNLTFRDGLLEDEAVVEGNTLFNPDLPEVQVSILDTVTEMQPLKIGDRIVFRIQGVPISAVVSSIRSQTREGLSPYFYFVFPENALASAPHTIFTAMRVPPAAIAALRNRVSAVFPNVISVDVSQSAAELSKLMARLSVTVRFLAAFGILAGLLIIIGSVFSTRMARTREAVYYRILGARSRFVVEVFALENALLGSLGASMALLFAQIAAWWVSAGIFRIVYRPFFLESLVAVGAASLLIMLVGLIPSTSVLKARPARFLGSRSNE